MFALSLPKTVLLMRFLPRKAWHTATGQANQKGSCSRICLLGCTRNCQNRVNQIDVPGSLQQTESDVPEMSTQNESDVLEMSKQTESDVPELSIQIESDVAKMSKQSESDVLKLSKQSESDVLKLSKQSESDVLKLSKQSESDVPDLHRRCRGCLVQQWHRPAAQTRPTRILTGLQILST